MKVLFGVAIGYLLGTRAGRQRYETIVRTARRVADSPPVRSASAAAREKIRGL
jgi:hypothetical protein